MAVGTQDRRYCHFGKVLYGRADQKVCLGPFLRVYLLAVTNGDWSANVWFTMGKLGSWKGVLHIYHLVRASNLRGGVILPSRNRIPRKHADRELYFVGESLLLVAHWCTMQSGWSLIAKSQCRQDSGVLNWYGWVQMPAVAVAVSFAVSQMLAVTVSAARHITRENRCHCIVDMEQRRSHW